jgi:hypothetical protein
MKQLLYFICIGLLVACSSSGNQNTSEKELELRKKELDLKQKELELKEKELQAQQTENNNNQTVTPLIDSTNESPNKNTLKEHQAISNEDKLLGLWKYKNNGFLKITKDNSGRFIFQNGYNYNNDDENSIGWETEGNVFAKLLNGKLEGKYRVWEGSAPDAYSDTKFSIELKTDKKILFKKNVHTGGGNSFNESIEANKIR